MSEIINLAISTFSLASLWLLHHMQICITIDSENIDKIEFQTLGTGRKVFMISQAAVVWFCPLEIFMEALTIRTLSHIHETSLYYSKIPHSIYALGSQVAKYIDSNKYTYMQTNKHATRLIANRRFYPLFFGRSDRVILYASVFTSCPFPHLSRTGFFYVLFAADFQTQLLGVS